MLLVISPPSVSSSECAIRFDFARSNALGAATDSRREPQIESPACHGGETYPRLESSNLPSSNVLAVHAEYVNGNGQAVRLSHALARRTLP